jgi:hypothetical protein
MQIASKEGFIWEVATLTDGELRALLSLARSGATELAWARLDGLEDASVSGHASFLTLKGRLLKDRARKTNGTERAHLFAQSGEAYAAAAHLRPTDSYPLINAAAMALFAGDEALAKARASAALALIEDGIDPGETPYWRAATRAEALLLLGQDAAARVSLSAAINDAPQAWEDRAATLRQFAFLLNHRGQPDDWLDQLRPPPVLHFSGTLAIAPGDTEAALAIREAISRIAPGSGYGALAAGADIIAAEALVEGGAELHVVLPCAVDIFRALSVAPFGDRWTARFDRLIQTATSVECCFDTSALTRASVRQADAVVMGLAVSRSDLYECQARSLQVRRAGTAGGNGIWRASGRNLIDLAVETAAGTESAKVLPEGNIHFHLAQGKSEEPVLTVHPTFHHAMATANRDVCTAICCSLDDAQEPGIAEAMGMLKNAMPDAVLASRNVAFAALAEGACRHVEPLGEMALSSGQVPVFMLAFDGA